MATEFLEINSAYRNRTRWPLASDFDVFFSQSGVKDKLAAEDPVCASAPRMIFTPFTTITGSIVQYPTAAYPNDTGTGAGSAGAQIFVRVLSTQYMSREPSYYAGAVMVINKSTNPAVPDYEYYRISETIFYLVGPESTPQSSNLDTYDYFLFIMSNTLSANIRPGLPWEIRDPSQFTGSTFPVGPPVTVNEYFFPAVFIPKGVNSNNFYISYVLFNQTLNEWLKITYYNGVTHMASTYPYEGTPADFPADVLRHYTPGTWTREHTYILRRSPPDEFGTIVSVNPSNPFQVQLAPTSSSISNYYVGSFLRNQQPFLFYPYKFNNPNYKVMAYDPQFPDWGGPPGTVIPVATLDQPYDATLDPKYEILQFTNDNEFPFPYNGSIVSFREAVCFEVELLNLVLPNAFLNTAIGSRAIFYPYVYVELTPLNNSERFGPNSITSNNPNARRMLFRALVKDTVADTTSPFVRIDGGGMRQRVKLMPCDNFHFSVHLPGGELFQTVLPEFFSPDYPYELNQISAVFAFRKVD
jgi:hypothetical protein